MPDGVPKSDHDRHSKGSPGHDITDAIEEQSRDKTARAY
jgi:hypothetical protein